MTKSINQTLKLGNCCIKMVQSTKARSSTETQGTAMALLRGSQLTTMGYASSMKDRFRMIRWETDQEIWLYTTKTNNLHLNCITKEALSITNLTSMALCKRQNIFTMVISRMVSNVAQEKLKLNTSMKEFGLLTICMAQELWRRDRKCSQGRWSRIRKTAGSWN